MCGGCSTRSRPSPGAIEWTAGKLGLPQLEDTGEIPGGYWPAVVALGWFLIFELGYHDGTTNSAVGGAMIAFTIGMVGGSAVYGRRWLRQADAFGVAVLAAGQDGAAVPRRHRCSAAAASVVRVDHRRPPHRSAGRAAGGAGRHHVRLAGRQHPVARPGGQPPRAGPPPGSTPPGWPRSSSSWPSSTTWGRWPWGGTPTRPLLRSPGASPTPWCPSCWATPWPTTSRF